MFDMKSLQEVALAAQNKQSDYQDQVLNYLDRIVFALENTQFSLKEIEYYLDPKDEVDD